MVLVSNSRFNVPARHCKNKDVRFIGILNRLEVPEQGVRFVLEVISLYFRLMVL